MARLWRNTDGTREGKYLVQRRDGTVPEWPYFVIGAADPAAAEALIAYAQAARALGMDPEYCDDILDMAAKWTTWRRDHGAGDPDAPRHRKDNPAVVELMRKGHGA